MFGDETVGVIALGTGPATLVAVAGYADTRLDATSDNYAVIYQVPRDMTVDQFGLNITAKTGAPSFQFSIQGVDTSGDPDGTILGGGSPASTNAVPGTGFVWITLDNSIAVSRGQMICLVILDNTDDTPFFGFRNSGTTGDVMGYPVLNNLSAASLVTGGAGQIIAQGFVLPSGVGRRVKVHGLEVFPMIATSDFDVGIWDDSSSATEIAAVAMDEFHFGTPGAQGNTLGFFDGVWLQAGTRYYAGIKQTDAAGVVAIYGNDVDTNDNLSAFTQNGNGGLSWFTAGAWNQSTGHHAMSVNLLISDWDKHGQEMQHLGAGMSR